MKSDTSEPHYVPSPKPRMLYGLAINDTHIFCVSVLLFIATLTFHRYLLSPDWATSTDGLKFIDVVSRFYPGLHDIKENWDGYTPWIGALFALMGVLMPIHWLLGFSSSRYFPKERHEKYIITSSRRQFFIVFMITFASATIPFFYPHIHGNGCRRLITNQASDSLTVLFGSWFIINAAIFGFGQNIGALTLRLQIKNFVAIDGDSK